MRLDKFIFLVFSTVFLGAFVGIIASASGFWIHVYWFTGLIEGGFLATTSLMGFWAYLMLNFIARMTLPRRLWVWIQSLLILWVMYDMFWTRYHDAVLLNPHHHATYMTYFVQGAWPLVVAIIGAIFKRRLSGPRSALPTVFYLYVFTIVDWLLVIWSNAGPVANETGIVMMACNVYLVLIFGKLLTKRVQQASVESVDPPQNPQSKTRSEAPSLQS